MSPVADPRPVVESIGSAAYSVLPAPPPGAEMAARASLFRTESRWGLYHHRVDYPQRDDAQWFCHTHLRKDEHGRMTSEKRAVEPYVVLLADDERSAYQKLRLRESADVAAAV